MLAALPYLLKHFKENKSMTAMEKAYAGLLVLVLQQLEKLDKELQERPVKADYDARVKENAKLSDDNEHLQHQVKQLDVGIKTLREKNESLQAEIAALRSKKKR